MSWNTSSHLCLNTKRVRKGRSEKYGPGKKKRSENGNIGIGIQGNKRRAIMEAKGSDGGKGRGKEQCRAKGSEEGKGRGKGQ